ncbi:hypothetical protein D6833_04145 [Candidatus Parcubacteria bacterium]|nr:MAG: hypothetical protein D6833_04145 [Candidatus Parcubacteria bacterium]
MAIGANSYGSVEEVAALVPRYTSNGSFTSSTRPTLTQVEQFIDRISGVLNVMLAAEGFAIPITQADAKLACDEIVVSAVVDLCHAANSAGRFYTDRELRGKSPFSVIRAELAEWVQEHAAGFERIGATRSTSLAEQIAYRDVDDAGDDVFPIFQRKGFGNQFTDWDT